MILILILFVVSLVVGIHVGTRMGERTPMPPKPKLEVPDHPCWETAACEQSNWDELITK